MIPTSFPVVAMLFVASIVATSTRAEPLVNIDTVAVGNPGNSDFIRGFAGGGFGDAAGAEQYEMLFGVKPPGAVAYAYRIGKFEVTIAQYTAFLNAVAAVPAGSHITDLWNPQMETDLNVAGIARRGSGTAGSPYTYVAIGPYGQTVEPSFLQSRPAAAKSTGDRPITYVSWFDAARFCNWLHNGAAVGADTENGAYTLAGKTNGIVLKNANAKWWIPSDSEWVKAAYYKGGKDAGYWTFPTQSDTEPGNSFGAKAEVGPHPPFLLFPVLKGNQANYEVPGIGYALTRNEDFLDEPLLESQNYLTDVGAFEKSASRYGTYDQGGNVREWTDTLQPGPNLDITTKVVDPYDPDGPLYRPARGGSYWKESEYLRCNFDDVYPSVPMLAKMAWWWQAWCLRNFYEEDSGTGFRLATEALGIVWHDFWPKRPKIKGNKNSQSIRLTLMVENASLQQETMDINITSSNPEIVPNPGRKSFTVPGRKNNRLPVAVARVPVSITVPANAAGRVRLTASSGNGVPEAFCDLVISPPRSR